MLFILFHFCLKYYLYLIFWHKKHWLPIYEFVLVSLENNIFSSRMYVSVMSCATFSTRKDFAPEGWPGSGGGRRKVSTQLVPRAPPGPATEVGLRLSNWLYLIFQRTTGKNQKCTELQVFPAIWAAWLRRGDGGICGQLDKYIYVQCHIPHPRTSLVETRRLFVQGKNDHITSLLKSKESQCS